METPAFEAQTHMLREDYRKFLYIATFFRSPLILPMILVMCGVGAALAGSQMGRSDPLYFVALWGAISVFVLCVVCFSVERKNKRRVAAVQQNGALDRRLVMRFFEEDFLLENPAREASRRIPYKEFHLLLETKDYFIFYLDKNQVTLLCKRDLEDAESFGGFIRYRFGSRYRRVNL